MKMLKYSQKAHYWHTEDQYNNEVRHDYTYKKSTKYIYKPNEGIILKTLNLNCNEDEQDRTVLETIEVERKTKKGSTTKSTK